MKNLRLTLLGGFEVERAGESISAFESDKDRLLLAYLALEHDRSHRRERLAGLFWPDKPENLARHSLSQTLSSLKKLFHDFPDSTILETSSQEVRFGSEDVWLDVQEFEALIGACAGHGHSPDWACRPCLERLERAETLYRGDFLSGYTLDGCAAFEEWLLVRQEAYRQKMIQACQWLAKGFELLGESEKALRYAERHIALNPIDEDARRMVMQLLAQKGRRAEALAQYAACQKILEEELGVEPEEATTALYQRILTKPGSEFSPPTSPHNLPARLTPLIGREKELEQVCHMLSGSACRLLTVLGGGGTGKSHLALEGGRLLLPAFPDGVFLVGLDTQQASQALAPLIAQAIELELRPGGTILGNPGGTGKESLQASLSSYLSSKKMLLILDGFEGSLPETGLVSSLLHKAPNLKMLVTSRARLNLECEHIFSLEGLAFPLAEQPVDPAGYSAVQLFVEGAQRAEPDFNLMETNQQAVAEICRLTQGLPLGLLLAASWIGTLEPAQIVQEIRRGLDFLYADWKDLPDRQRSLRATFDHSWRLLPMEERAIFLHLATFHNPFTSERAGQVAGASLHHLRTLSNQSLLMHVSTERDRALTRYRLHDLLRQYAQEKLAASSEDYLRAHEQHAQAYLAALAAWEGPLKSRAQPAALAEMDAEYGDIRAAWEWATAHRQVEQMQKAFEALSYYHTLRGFFKEDAALCQKEMESLEKEPFTPSSLRLWVHMSAWLVQDLNTLALFDAAWEVLGKVEAVLSEWEGLMAEMPRTLAWLYLAKGELCIYTSNHVKGLEAYQQGLELMRLGENPWDISVGLWKVAVGQGQVGDVREMGRFANEALIIQRELGDPYILALSLTQLSFYYMLSGQYQAGIQAVQEQHVNLRYYKDPRSQAIAHREMGIAMFYAGQFEQARIQFEKMISLEAVPEQGGAPKSILYFLACIDLHTGEYLAVLKDTAYTGLPLTPFDLACLGLFKAQVHLLEEQAGIRTDLDSAENDLKNYLETMRSLPRLDMLGMPLALLGFIAYRRGNLEVACQYLDQALSNALKQGIFVACLVSLSVLALMLAEAGELEQAVELYATVTAHPCAGNSRWHEDMFGKRLRTLSSSLPAEVIAAAQARGGNHDYFETGQKYLDCLRLSHEGRIPGKDVGKVIIAPDFDTPVPEFDP